MAGVSVRLSSGAGDDKKENLYSNILNIVEYLRKIQERKQIFNLEKK